MSRRGRIAIAVLAGAGMMILLVLWRNFFLLHASIVGAAVALLVYSVLRSAEKLRRTYRR